MKPGQESQTAIMVCAARAAAHGRTPVTQFSDPTALALLPPDARAQVERYRAGVQPANVREGFGFKVLQKRGAMMVARTVALDDAIRMAASPQLVILGAGLDGRAWRMAELSGVTVFEVDHPDSQQRKRERVAPLTQVAGEVRFVPVDFTRDNLNDALVAAGHDPTRQTTWLWEGVVMYLERPEIEAALRVVQHRSKPGCVLAVVYQSPSLLRTILGAYLRRFGEPFRSAFTAAQMRALLGDFGFTLREDDSLADFAARLSAGLAGDKQVLKSARVAVARIA